MRKLGILTNTLPGLPAFARDRTRHHTAGGTDVPGGLLYKETAS